MLVRMGRERFQLMLLSRASQGTDKYRIPTSRLGDSGSSESHPQPLRLGRFRVSVGATLHLSLLGTHAALGLQVEYHIP